MGLRDSINRQNPIIVGVIVSVVIVAVLFLIFRSKAGNAGRPDGALGAFFTTDDGKTWFPGNTSKLPPFTVDGKTAVRAYVYKCADGKPFVGFLERYTPQGKKNREALASAPIGKDAAFLLDQSSSTEVKRPGQPVWIKQSDPKAASIILLRCPDGTPPEMVHP